MFNNPGGKLKSLAKVFFWLNLILFILGGIFLIVMAIENDVPMLILAGVLAIGVGILIAWLSTILLYAFGELVESNTRLAEKVCGGAPVSSGSAYYAAPKPSVCPNCGAALTPGSRFCTTCGKGIN